MNRSTDIRSSIPTEQCLAMARVSSDWTWNGGNTPVMNPHPEWWKEGNLALTGLHNTLLPQATWNLYNAQALFQLVIRSHMGPTWCCPIKSIEFIQDGWFPNTWSSNHSNHCEICIICWQKLQLQVRAPSPSCIECKPTRQTAALCHHDKNQAYSYCLTHGSKIRFHNCTHDTFRLCCATVRCISKSYCLESTSRKIGLSFQGRSPRSPHKGTTFYSGTGHCSRITKYFTQDSLNRSAMTKTLLQSFLYFCTSNVSIAKRMWLHRFHEILEDKRYDQQQNCSPNFFRRTKKRRAWNSQEGNGQGRSPRNLTTSWVTRAAGGPLGPRCHHHDPAWAWECPQVHHYSPAHPHLHRSWVWPAWPTRFWALLADLMSLLLRPTLLPSSLCATLARSRSLCPALVPSFLVSLSRSAHSTNQIRVS